MQIQPAHRCAPPPKPKHPVLEEFLWPEDSVSSWAHNTLHCMVDPAACPDNSVISRVTAGALTWGGAAALGAVNPWAGVGAAAVSGVLQIRSAGKQPMANPILDGAIAGGFVAGTIFGAAVAGAAGGLWGVAGSAVAGVMLETMLTGR